MFNSRHIAVCPPSLSFDRGTELNKTAIDLWRREYFMKFALVLSAPQCGSEEADFIRGQPEVIRVINF